MEKLEKEGIVSYESSPVNTEKDQEEDLSKKTIDRENKTSNLNFELDKKENLPKSSVKEKKDKYIESKEKKTDELRESLFIEKIAIKGNRRSLFRGDIFDLEFENDKKVYFIILNWKKQYKILIAKKLSNVK